ncbi:KR domain-containing protein [Bacillus velezensis]|nr:KR domain-containing protein [Bacillus velezensis]
MPDVRKMFQRRSCSQRRLMSKAIHGRTGTITGTNSALFLYSDRCQAGPAYKRRRLCRHRRRGGIGEAWSEYAVKTYQARVVWIGRRKHNSAIQEKIDRLSQFGPAPIYIEADAANPNELTRAYETIKRTHLQINGIIHSAIVLEDQSLANMPESRLKSVLARKSMSA